MSQRITRYRCSAGYGRRPWGRVREGPRRHMQHAASKPNLCGSLGDALGLNINMMRAKVLRYV
jgi:hypothetical protein